MACSVYGLKMRMDLKVENINERMAWKKRKAGEYNESEIQREKSKKLLRV